MPCLPQSTSETKGFQLVDGLADFLRGARALGEAGHVLKPYPEQHVAGISVGARPIPASEGRFDPMGIVWKG